MDLSNMRFDEDSPAELDLFAQWKLAEREETSAQDRPLPQP